MTGYAEGRESYWLDLMRLTFQAVAALEDSGASIPMPPGDQLRTVSVDAALGLILQSIGRTRPTAPAQMPAFHVLSLIRGQHAHLVAVGANVNPYELAAQAIDLGHAAERLQLAASGTLKVLQDRASTLAFFESQGASGGRKGSATRRAKAALWKLELHARLEDQRTLGALGRSQVNLAHDLIEGWKPADPAPSHASIERYLQKLEAGGHLNRTAGTFTAPTNPLP